MDSYFAPKSGIVRYKWWYNDALFSLKRGTRQGYFGQPFVLVLEIVFIFIEESENVQGLTIFNNQFSYTAYADDTTFFLSNGNSVMEVMQVFEHYSVFSLLKPNKSKCEIEIVENATAKN